MPMTMALQPPLARIYKYFIHEEFVRVLHQAAELKVALKLYQVRMKEVCHSIKAHYYWVHYGQYFPSMLYCPLCSAFVSPEFDKWRHKGLCTRFRLMGD